MPPADAGPRLSAFGLLIRYFRIVWTFSGSKAIKLLVLIVLTAFTEAIGITLFLPFLSQSNITAAGTDRVSVFLNHVFALFGGAPSASAVLTMIVIVFLLKGAMTFVEMVYQAYVNSLLFERIRGQMLAAYAAMDYRFYLEKHSGYFANVITIEVTRAVSFFSVYLTVLSCVINAALFLAISLAINFEFTFAAIVFGAVVLFLSSFIAERARRYSLELSRENSTFHSLLIETIQSFKYLVSTASFMRLQGKLLLATRRLVGLELKLNAVSSVVFAFSESITVSGLVALIYFQVVVQGKNMSAILVTVMLFYRALMMITSFQKNWQTLSGYAGGIETVVACIREFEHQREPLGARRVAAMTDGIELRGVSFQYGDRTVLRDVSLRIPRNALVAFVGDSGAGKSTLVDLVTGILKPQRGAVLVDGVSLQDLDAREWRKRIGYVTQEGVQFDATVSDNISLWSCGKDDPRCHDAVRRAAQAARCDEFIQEHPDGYEAVIGDRGLRLSGGQRQRLSIARELFKQPDVLILDEATSALDTEVERSVQQSIDALRGRATVIIIAHRLSTVRGCDRIFVVDGGTVAEQGSFGELLGRADSWFARMCALQNTVRT